MNHFDKTKQLIASSLAFTQSVIQKSKRLRTPPAHIDKLGTAVGGIAGVICAATGLIQLALGRSTWAVGILTLGVVALISNGIHYLQIKSRS